MNKNRSETTRYGTFLLKTRVWSVPAYVHSSEPYVYGFTFSFAFHTMINHDKLNQRRPSMAMGITEQKTRRERERGPAITFLCAKFLCILPCFIFSESQLENPQSQEIFKVAAAAAANCHFCTQTLPTRCLDKSKKS